MRVVSLVALTTGGFLAGGLLTACSSLGMGEFTVFADPAKYEFHTCEQLLPERKRWADRELELKLLMDRAKRGAGGTFVNVIAYQGDYIAAREEVKVLDATARIKKCHIPDDGPNNSAIR